MVDISADGDCVLRVCVFNGVSARFFRLGLFIPVTEDETLDTDDTMVAEEDVFLLIRFFEEVVLDSDEVDVVTGADVVADVDVKEPIDGNVLALLVLVEIGVGPEMELKL
jgi:hypothetical protein